MNGFRRLWGALRAAVLATAVFWVTRVIVESSGWQAPFGLTAEALFFLIFFFGVLAAR